VSLAAIRRLLSRPLLYIALAAGIASFFASPGGGTPGLSTLQAVSPTVSFQSDAQDVVFDAIHQIDYTNHTEDSVTIRSSMLTLWVTSNGDGGEGLECSGVRFWSSHPDTGVHAVINGTSVTFAEDVVVSNSPKHVVFFVEQFVDGQGLFDKGNDDVSIDHRTSDSLLYGLNPTCSDWANHLSIGFNFLTDGWYSVASSQVTYWDHDDRQNN